MRATLARLAGAVALATVATTGLSAAPVAAQLGDPAGPGQAVPQPAAQCAQTVSCEYSERNYLPNGYRFQRLFVCGADCSSQYWVSTLPDATALLTIAPTRFLVILAVGRPADPQDTHPPIRVVQLDSPLPDARYTDTTYTWEAARNALVAGASTTIPATEIGGVRQQLEAEHFFEVFPGL